MLLTERRGQHLQVQESVQSLRVRPGHCIFVTAKLQNAPQNYANLTFSNDAFFAHGVRLIYHTHKRNLIINQPNVSKLQKLIRCFSKLIYLTSREEVLPQFSHFSFI